MTYGSLNENLLAVQSKIMQSKDLMKFLYYKDNGDITALPNLTSDQIKSLMKNTKYEDSNEDGASTQRIFPFKKLPKDSDRNTLGCFISMEYGVIERESRQRGKSGGYWKKPSFCIFLFVPDRLDPTKNGSRLLAMEQCIEDAFNGRSLEAISHCYVGNSLPLQTASGYIGRQIPLIFVDKNEGVWNG